MIEILGTPVFPDSHRFVAFALAGLLLNLVPGADMIYVITSSVRARLRGGIAASLGIAVGALVHLLAAAVGFSALLLTSATAFAAVKYAGAAYLLYLAVINLRRPTTSGVSQTETVALNIATIFRSGILINLLNPKVALFFLAFLPQFVDAHAQVPAAQIVALGLWFNIVGTLVNIAVAYVTGRAAVATANLRSVQQVGKWLVAAIFGVLAFQLATSATVRR